MSNEKQKYTVWVEAEYWRPGEWIPDDDSTDVVVTWEDGSRWGATFVSYQHIKTLTVKNKQTGECLSGAYLWISDMILVDNVSRSRIEEIIWHLIASGEFVQAFRAL
jgi:hypothetical protein